MSEFQYIGFRAIDGPVTEKNLAFMRRQSSRAEITPWSFDNEYHYGDFHGDAAAMLRRGYDFYLHYANFGTRTLMIRLPRSASSCIEPARHTSRLPCCWPTCVKRLPLQNKPAYPTSRRAS